MENNKKYILGLGHPFIDITGSITKEISQMLKVKFFYNLKIGHTIKLDEKNIDIFNFLENSKNIKISAGGSCMNTIRVASVY